MRKTVTRSSKSSRQLSRVYLVRLTNERLLLFQSNGRGELTSQRDAEIISSGHLSDEERADARSVLMERAEKDISALVQEHTYIPRLVVSAIIFLLSYFFFSLALRDPVPLVDEIAISLALSALSFIFVRRKIGKTRLFDALLDEFRVKLSSLVERESEAVSSLEAWYEELERTDRETMIRILSGLEADTLPSFSFDDRDLLHALVDYTKGEGRQYGGWIRTMQKSGRRPLVSLLRQAVAVDGIDPCLLYILRKATFAD